MGATKERFGVAVEPGTLEKLRVLAGGERKIGEYLTDVIDFLWSQRDVMDDVVSPTSGLEALEADILELRAKVVFLRARARRQQKISKAYNA